MLINFSVENFRSFGQEQTLSLVADSTRDESPCHMVPLAETGRHVLRTAMVYGANASGKSNLVRAMSFARNLILRGAGPSTRISLDQFRFTRSEPRPSSFEFRFLVGGTIFVYGFDISQEGIVEEWLSILRGPNREADLFRRIGKRITFGDQRAFEPDSPLNKTLKALEQLGVRSNQLLLNKIVDLASENRGKLLNQVVMWFSQCLTIILPEASFNSIIEFVEADPAFGEFVGEFLRSTGTGIEGLLIEQERIDADRLPKDLLEALASRGDVGTRPIVMGPGVSLSLDPDDPGQAIRRNLATRHHVAGDEFSLPFHDESDGTQRFSHLLPALFHSRMPNRVFVIDELDRSLHPLLAHAYLRFFIESCPGEPRQLVATTHETFLLDQDLIRRDEVWFTEKDERQQTHLYPLTDLKVRKDLRYGKSYLQGRFGAIPFVGGLERIRELAQCAVGEDDA
jgi:hypothetical protein